jgi:hypothetical protein
MVMVPEGGAPDPVQLYVRVTTIWVALAFTLKLKDTAPATVRLTATVWVIVPSLAVTTIDVVPLGVVVAV